MFTERNFLSKLNLFLIGCLFLSTLSGSTTAANAQTETLQLNADAVNLRVEKHYTLTSDGAYKLHLYIKRQILTYKGKKEYADFKFTYNRTRQQVKLLKALTTTEKGEVLTVKPEEMHDIPASWNSDASLYSQTRQMVVSLPAVEPGSIIEVEIEITCKNGFWCKEYFRLNNPILYKEVIIDTPASLKLHYRAPQNVKLDFQQKILDNGDNRYQWQGKNIPALTPEKGASSHLEQGFCLLASNFSSWRQVADFFNKSFTTALQTEKNKPTKTMIDSSTTTPTSHRLYRKIRALTTYAISFQETDFKVQPSSETKKLGYGTDCDLALFFMQQLKLYQQPADIIMVDSQNLILEKFTDFPYPGWWDTAMVQSGADFFLFSSAKAAPGITGFEKSIGLNLSTGKLTTIKDRKANQTNTRLNLDLSNFPACRGQLELTLNGAAATDWRSQWRDLSQPEIEIASSQFLHQIDPEAEFTGKLLVTGLKDDRRELTFQCQFKQSNACTKFRSINTKHLYLLSFKAPDLPYPLVSLLKERQQPITIASDELINDEVTIKLPEHAQVISHPQATSGKLPQFSWQITCTADPETNTLIYKRKIKFNRGIIPARNPEYKEFITVIRSFYRPEALRIIFTLE